MTRLSNYHCRILKTKEYHNNIMHIKKLFHITLFIMFTKSLFAFSLADSSYTTVYFRCDSSKCLILIFFYHNNISSIEILLSNICLIIKDDIPSPRHIHIVSGTSIAERINTNKNPEDKVLSFTY